MNLRKLHHSPRNNPLPGSVENEPLSFSLCFVCGLNQGQHQPAPIKQLTFGSTTKSLLQFFEYIKNKPNVEWQ